MDTNLRSQALKLLLTNDADLKANLTEQLDLDGNLNVEESFAELHGIPGRPPHPLLVSHTELKQRSLATMEGRGALIHALCHIELNAVDLALDISWRFPGMPADFYMQWLQVAKEEALHFRLLRDHLKTLGFKYGDFPAHNALWEMAERTKHDLLARLALVPRTMEARGLDASPPLRKKMISVGDKRASEILDIILRDEIGHVLVGNRWFNYLCEKQHLDPIATYADLAKKYDAPKLRGPFNMEAREAAGFTQGELMALIAD